MAAISSPYPPGPDEAPRGKGGLLRWGSDSIFPALGWSGCYSLLLWRGGNQAHSFCSLTGDQRGKIKTFINPEKIECLEPRTCAVPPAHR